MAIRARPFERRRAVLPSPPMDRSEARGEPTVGPERLNGPGRFNRPERFNSNDWLRTSVVFAAAGKTLVVLLMLIVWREFLSPGTFPGIVPLAHMAVFAGAALFLAVVGGRDRRALDLGSFFLLVAAAFAHGMLYRLEGLEASARLVQQAMLALHPEAFLPVFLWRFVSRFPRLHRFDRGQAFERTFLGVSVVLGAVCFVASASRDLLEGSQVAFISVMAWGTKGGWFDATLFGLALPALPFGLWKARRADPTERRRYSLFIAGLLVGFVPLSLQVLAEAVSPAFDAFMNVGSRRVLAGAVLFPLLLSTPLTATYAVVVHRVLDVRLIVRNALRYLLARYTLMAGALGLLAVLFAAVYRHRDESVGALLSTTSGLTIVIPLAVLLALLGWRGSILDAIDRRFFREALDARAVLGRLAETGGLAGDTLASLCVGLARTLGASLHVTRCEILVADLDRQTLVSPSGELGSLSLQSRIAAALQGSPDGLVVELDQPDSTVGEFPADEQQWLADGDVHFLIPFAAGREIVGVLALGEKLSELPFSREDRNLLGPVASALALRIENLRLREARTPSLHSVLGLPERDLRDDPALFCVGCAHLSPAGSSTCLRCAQPVEPIQLPLLLAGKFRLERELGRGGMGVVYSAIDVALERRVAIKTLPRVSVAESVRLRHEARAMASFAHPHLASIFGIESYRGVPALVMEYLDGGTLAERLRRSRLSPAETVSLARDLAGALASIHDQGLLHRDIKPSNIAFSASSGVPKLLDFGLAQMFRHRVAPYPEDPASAGSLGRIGISDATTADGIGGIAGTVSYMSPEAIGGQPLDGSTDLWSLGVVLFECLTSERPFKGTPTKTDLSFRIEESVPECPASLRAVVADLLAIDRRRRPKSAREVLSRLPPAAALETA